MELNKDQQSKWQSKLLELQSTLKHELATTQESARPVDLNQPIGRLTRVDAMQQQQMALARRDRIRIRLQAISSALGRIKAGNYGECLQCEEEIDPRRLDARPETVLCLNCQKNKE